MRSGCDTTTPCARLSLASRDVILHATRVSWAVGQLASPAKGGGPLRCTGCGRDRGRAPPKRAPRRPPRNRQNREAQVRCPDRRQRPQARPAAAVSRIQVCETVARPRSRTGCDARRLHPTGPRDRRQEPPRIMGRRLLAHTGASANSGQPQTLPKTPKEPAMRDRHPVPRRRLPPLFPPLLPLPLLLSLPQQPPAPPPPTTSPVGI